MKFGYARVSRVEQSVELQTDALAAAGCNRIFIDKASGALERRPELDRVLDMVRPGDTIVVWRLDRLGRSLKHLMSAVADLEKRGIAFQSLTEAIDTSTPGGKLVFHVFGALAEFERALVHERTMAGLEAARARGRFGGRPTVWTKKKAAIALRMYDEKSHTIKEIADVVGVSRATLYRLIEDRDAKAAATAATGTPDPQAARPPRLARS